MHTGLVSRRVVMTRPCSYINMVLRTPVDTESKLDSNEDPIYDPTLYRSLAALKRVIRYVRGTLDFGLQLYASNTCSFVAYTDVDWACYPTTRRSSVESEYKGVANVVSKISLLRNLLKELHTPLLSATLVYCDNVSAIYMTANSVQHLRAKHIEIDIHFVRDMVACGQVRVLRVPSRYQTPVDTESKLDSNEDPIYDPTLYRSLAGGLQYLTFTRLDISYAVQ
nr:ribonuclease H-like domain-containing protein [Tanacetum cinerariifolium]